MTLSSSNTPSLTGATAYQSAGRGRFDLSLDDIAKGKAVLLDELMPVYDVVERHQTAAHATPEQVFDAIRTADLTGDPVTRTLFAVRALPAALLAFARSPRAAFNAWGSRIAGRHRGARLTDLEHSGFRVIAERAPEELVIGLLGKFWTPRGGLCTEVSAAHFAAGPPRGYALAGWSFAIVSKPDGGTVLRTETRVWCAPDARLRFRAYWLLVRPGSGLIRRSMLRSIRREAERRSDAMSSLGARLPM